MNASVGRLVVAGDFCPVSKNLDAFAKGNANLVFGNSLLNLFRDSLGAVLNLETPLTDGESPIAKAGPCLRSPTFVARILGELNLLGVGIANNHVLDQGSQGFADTLAALDGAGIARFGGGVDLAEARRPLIANVGGRRVGLYACAEHEFTIAGVTSPGSNPFDAPTAFNDVRTLAAGCDAVIVLYHGMKEFYRYPSPEVQRRCRGLVDAGAAFVTCQHSHCIGCAEEYDGATILYGQGDFCFCKGDENPMRRDGLLALFDPMTLAVEFVPVTNEGGAVNLASGGEEDSILAAFKERSDEITEPGFVERSWGEFCERVVDNYALQLVAALEPKPFHLLARVLAKLGVGLRLGKGEQVAHLLNMVQCEAHSEVVSTALRRRLNG